MAKKKALLTLKLATLITWVKSAAKMATIAQIHSLSYDKVVIDNNFIEERRDSQLMISKVDPADKNIEILTPDNLKNRFKDIEIKEEFGKMKLIEHNLLCFISDFKQMSLFKINQGKFEIEKIENIILEFDEVENFKIVDALADYSSDNLMMLIQNKNIEEIKNFKIGVRKISDSSQKVKIYSFKLAELGTKIKNSDIELKFFRPLLRKNIPKKEKKIPDFFTFVYIQDPYGMNNFPLKFSLLEFKKSGEIVQKDFSKNIEAVVMRAIYDNGETDSIGIIYSKFSDKDEILYKKYLNYNKNENFWIFSESEEIFFKNEKIKNKELGVFTGEVKNSRRIRMTGASLKGVFIHQIPFESQPLITYIPSLPKIAVKRSKETYLPVSYSDDLIVGKDHYYKIDGKILREKPTQIKFIAIKKVNKGKSFVPYQSVSNIKQSVEEKNDFMVMTKTSIFRFDGEFLDSHINQVSLSVLDMNKFKNDEIDENISIQCKGEIVQNQYLFNWNQRISDPLETKMNEFWIEVEPSNSDKDVLFTEIDRDIAKNVEAVEIKDKMEGVDFRKISLKNNDLSGFEYKIWKFFFNQNLAFGCNIVPRGKSGFQALDCDIFKTKLEFNENFNLEFLPTKQKASFNILPDSKARFEKIDFHCMIKMEKIQPFNYTGVDDTETEENGKNLESDLTENPYNNNDEIITTAARYCQYFILSNKTAHIGNFSIYEIDENYYYQFHNNKKIEDVDDISIMKFEPNRTNEFLSEIGEGVQRKGWNLETGFYYCSRFECFNLFNPIDYSTVHVDFPSNYCPVKIHGLTFTKQLFTYSTRISQCEGNSEISIYADYVKLSIPVDINKDNFDKDLFCRFKKYYAFFDKTEKKVRLGALDSEFSHLSKSYVFTEELGFKNIKKLICGKELIVIGERLDKSQKLVSAAAVYYAKLLRQDARFYVMADESMIEKTNFLLDVVEMDDVYSDFELFYADLSYEKLTGYEKDVRGALILKSKNNGFEKLFHLTKNKNFVEMIYSTKLKEEQNYRYKIKAVINKKYTADITLAGIKAIKGDFKIKKINSVRLQYFDQKQFKLKDLLEIENPENIFTYSLSSDGYEMLTGDYKLRSCLEQPFEKILSENFFDGNILQLTEFGYAIQITSIEKEENHKKREKGEEKKYHHLIKLKIYDFWDIDNPNVYPTEIYAKIDNFGEFGKDLKIDIKSFDFDYKDIDLICIDFRRLGIESYGLGKGDFDVNDLIKLEKSKSEEDSNNSDHNHRLLSSQAEEPIISERFSYSVGVMIERGEGIISQGHYGHSLRVYNSILFRDTDYIGSTKLINSQILSNDKRLKSHGYTNTTLGLSLPSLSHDSIRSFTYKQRRVFLTSEFLKTEKNSYVVFIETNSTNHLKIGKLAKEGNDFKLDEVKKIDFEEKFLYENLTCRGFVHEKNNPLKAYLGHCVVFQYGRSHIHFRIPFPDEKSEVIKVKTKILTYPVQRFHLLTEPDGKLTDNFFLAYRRNQNEKDRGFVDCIIWHLDYKEEENKILTALKNYRFSLDEKSFQTHVYSGAFEAKNGDLYFQKNTKIFKIPNPSSKSKINEIEEKNLEEKDGLIILSTGNPRPIINQKLHISNGRKEIVMNMSEILIPLKPDMEKYYMIYKVINWSIYIAFGLITVYGFFNCFREIKKLKRMEIIGEGGGDDENDGYVNVGVEEDEFERDLRRFNLVQHRDSFKKRPKGGKKVEVSGKVEEEEEKKMEVSEKVEEEEEEKMEVSGKVEEEESLMI